MTTIALARTTKAARPLPSRGKFNLGHLCARIWRNYVTRRQLAELDDRMLQDLGISRAQAQFEANRPIWH
jgi:uncharacterized protein YjiS (DUF1127 family)